MRLTSFTNYSLRLLMYAALCPERAISVREVSEAYSISANHIKKAAAYLVSQGYLNASQGRNGGYFLARDAESIRIGDVVRVTEDHLNLVECFDAKTNTCPLIGVCKFSCLFQQALKAFMDVLDGCTLADMIAEPKQLQSILFS